MFQAYNLYGEMLAGGKGGVMEYHDTFTGKRFGYTGSTAAELVIYPLDKQGVKTSTKLPVSQDTICFIVNQIRLHGTIKMGACRDKPSKGSLGEVLLDMKKTPQVLSYVLPLLKKVELIRSHKEGRSFWVTWQA
jgi:hypothetical protein